MPRSRRNGRGERRPDGPLQDIDAALDRPSLDTRFCRPVSYGQPPTVEFDIACLGRIPHLLRAVWRPAHVLGLVMPVVVNSIQSVFGRWRGTHIRQECLKRTPPPLAHRDPSPAVSGVAVHRGVRAPPYHRVPGAPLLRSLRLLAVPVLVLVVFLAVLLSGLRAPAALRAAVPEVSLDDEPLPTADAPAEPLGSQPQGDFARGGVFDDGPASEGIADLYHPATIALNVTPAKTRRALSPAGAV